jgi:hypothetical protein
MTPFVVSMQIAHAGANIDAFNVSKAEVLE